MASDTQLCLVAAGVRRHPQANPAAPAAGDGPA